MGTLVDLMGFEELEARAALEAAKGDVQVAVSKLLAAANGRGGPVHGAGHLPGHGFQRGDAALPRNRSERAADAAAAAAAAAGFSTAEVVECQATVDGGHQEAGPLIEMLRRRRSASSEGDEVVYLSAAVTETFGARPSATPAPTNPEG